MLFHWLEDSYKRIGHLPSSRELHSKYLLVVQHVTLESKTNTDEICADFTLKNEKYCSLKDKDHATYRSLFGEILYAAVCKRPDIAFTNRVL